MGELKARDYSFDAVRGFCMILIPFQHYMVAEGNFHYEGLEGYLFFVIDLFVMQGFFFLSGFFSKKPERSREVAFKALLWPLIIVVLILAAARAVFVHEYEINFFSPPFAMWFLLCLFYYRVFQKNYVNIRHFFGIVFLAGLLIGPIPFIGVKLSAARAINWMPYFLLGYHCSFEQIDRVRRIKRRYIVCLGAALLTGAWLFMRYVPFHYAAVQMFSHNRTMEITWVQNILMHIVLLPVSIAFLVILFNLFPNKKGFWSFIGQNTMPIYIFHVFLSFIFMRTGLTFGLFTPPEPGTAPHILLLVALTVVTTLLFVSKPVVWFYDCLFTKSYDAFIWAIDHIASPIGGLVEAGWYAVWPFKVPESSKTEKSQKD